MGLDIHASIEVLERGNDTYDLFATVILPRDHEAFNSLLSHGLPAGMQPDYRFPGPSRGFPMNSCETLTEEYDAIRAETVNASWLDKNELRSMSFKSPLSRAYLSAVVEAMEAIESMLDAKTRFVFWFF